MNGRVYDLHAHVFPRYADEPAHLATANPWSYDWAAAPKFQESRDRALMHGIRAAMIASCSLRADGYL